MTNESRTPVNPFYCFEQNGRNRTSVSIQQVCCLSVTETQQEVNGKIPKVRVNPNNVITRTGVPI